MHRFALSERFVASPKRVPARGRADFFDAQVPGLALRVTEKGHRSFVFVARYPLNPKNPTRRLLGTTGAITLAGARDKAREWIACIEKGIDPRVAAARSKAEERKKHANTFATVWDTFEEQHASKLSKADEAKRAGAAFKKCWGFRPAVEIEPDEIAVYVRGVAQKTPAEARNQLGHLRRMYSWTIGAGGSGITTNPCDALRPTDLIGAKIARDRILSDAEIRSIWGACEGLGYPFGPLVKLLTLSAQRVREVANAAWSEFDLDKGEWIIPAARMKSDRAHLVPLAPDALTLLKTLPRFEGGDFLFTTTGGRRPVSGFSKFKARIDEKSGITGWVLHDVRRTVRTGFSALPVQDMVRELVIAHARPGLHKVYDLYAYHNEKQECLERWEKRLRGILNPKPPADVKDLEAERVRRRG